MSAALLLFQLYLEHCFDDGVCASCTCSACWRRYLCVVLISEKVYVAWDVCVAIALCGHSNIGHALRLCLSTTSTRCKGQGARCKGQDQHQCKLVRDAATRNSCALTQGAVIAASCCVVYLLIGHPTYELVAFGFDLFIDLWCI